MKRQNLVSTFIILLTVLISLSSAHAQQNSLSEQDMTFMNEAAIGGIKEVQLGLTASQKAASDDVKRFGERMVNDHSKVNDELMSLSQKKGVELPKKLDEEAQQTVDRLTKLEGAEFDREYMREMLRDHQEDVEEFRKQAEEGQDPDVKAFASKTLPILEEHLQLAKEIHGKVEAAQ